MWTFYLVDIVTCIITCVAVLSGCSLSGAAGVGGLQSAADNPESGTAVSQTVWSEGDTGGDGWQVDGRPKELLTS